MNNSRTFLSWAPCVIALVATSTDLARAQVESISCVPSKVNLAYGDDHQQVIVIAKFADGSTREVTSESEFTLANSAVAKCTPAGKLSAFAAGTTALRVSWRGHDATGQFQVQRDAVDRPLRFRNDVLPILTKAGCNAGKCHGSASGKDGFRLSLYGFDPEGDYYRLTRQMSGRRINLAKPDDCLLVNKAIGEVPHTGGTCIEIGSPEYVRLVTWIAKGAKPDPADVPQPVGIDVYPQRAVMSQPGQEQALVVMASYDDGTQRDVSDLAVYISNNDAAATVSTDGTILGTGPGSGFVMARFDQFTAGTAVVVRSGRAYPGLAFEPNNYIDELAGKRWRDLQVLPAEVCDDETFLRRVYLDMTGLLPTQSQRLQFLGNKSADKRQRLVDELADSKAFLDLWGMQLAELLQIRRTNGLSSKGLQRYDEWLRSQVRAGVTVDEILKQVIPASGGTFENPATVYYQTETTPQLLAENIAQAFLGTRIQCAQCHNHPFDRWTMDDYYGFASFVSQVGYKQAKDPREITVYNLGEGSLQHPVAGREVRPKYLGGKFAELETTIDRRQALAQWLTSPENMAFAKNIANILWAHFNGAGIVNPVDDVRISNPPTNPELLEALGKKLVQYDFDVRRLARDICSSKTYQLGTSTSEWNQWDDRNFSHARIRRLRAEVLLDCINQVTHGSDRLSGLPLGGRAIEVPDGNSNNYFLETFGRASRRTPCSCEVSTSPTLSQALHLLNGENTSGKIEQGGVIDQLLADGLTPMEIAEHIYLTCFTRLPSNDERTSISGRLSVAEDPRSELVDLFWAILNSNEFIFNH